MNDVKKLHRILLLLPLLYGCTDDPTTPTDAAIPDGDAAVAQDAALPDDQGASDADTDALPGDGGSGSPTFAFAEVPDVVFVRGEADTEFLGIYQLDPDNRYTPGDLVNAAKWSAKKPCSVSGSLPKGVTYDAAAATLKYDGSGSGSETATIQLQHAALKSNSFTVRVVVPTVTFGTGATYDFDYGADGALAWENAIRALNKTDNVLYVAPGTYADCTYGWTPKNQTSVIIVGGTPRPKIVKPTSVNQTGISFGDGVQYVYVKNVELDGFSLTERNHTSHPTIVVNRVFLHDHTGSGLVFGDDGNTTATTHRFWLVNSELARMGQGNAYHNIYCHGRGATYLHANNIRSYASNGSSNFKATTRNITVHNAYFGTLDDWANPSTATWSGPHCDHMAAGEHIYYNNHFKLARSTTLGGTSYGGIFLRARRSLTGCDEPPYGSTQFLDPAFWQQVSAKPMTDPQNPHSFRHYMAFNDFEWVVVDTDNKEGPAFSDAGTYPREAPYQFANCSKFLSVPSGWVERSVSFFLNNDFSSFSADNQLFDPDQVECQDASSEAGAQYPPPTRHVVEVGGNDKQAAPVKPVAIPSWFKYGRL